MNENTLIRKVRAIAKYDKWNEANPQGVRSWRYVAVFFGGREEVIRKSATRLYEKAFLYDYKINGGNKTGLALVFAFGKKDGSRNRPAIKVFPVEVVDELTGQPRIDSWNTGQLYSEAGQRIAAMELDFVTYFHDADRGITGKIHKTRPKLWFLQTFVMSIYQVDFEGYEGLAHGLTDEQERALRLSALTVPTVEELKVMDLEASALLRESYHLQDSGR